MDKLLQEVKTYLKLVKLVKKNLAITWIRGYYWSKNKKLRKKEVAFLKAVPQYEKAMLRRLREDPYAKNILYYVTLLGWGKDIKTISQHLIRLFDVKSCKLHNYTARAIFPFVVTGKAKLAVTKVLELLDHRSPYCKNKALGILAFMPLTKKDERQLRSHLIQFDGYTRSKKKIVARPAKILLKRLQK